MKAQRLNKITKRQILENVIEQTLWPRYRELLANEGKLAMEARSFSFGGKIDEVEKIIQQITEAKDRLTKITGSTPSLMLGIRSDDINVNVDGMRFRLSFYKDAESIEFSGVTDSSVRNCNQIAYHGARFYLATEGDSYSRSFAIHGESLKKRIFDHIEAKETLEKEVETVCLTVRGILDKCATVKKLIELWPECEQYIPAEFESQVKQLNLPISIADLNSKLSAYQSAA